MILDDLQHSPPRRGLSFTDSKQTCGTIGAIMQLHIDPTTPVFLTPYADTIKNTWSAFTQTRTITENATLLRYLSHTEKTITVAQDISYKDIIGLRFKQTPLRQPPFLALSAIAIVRTTDGHYFLQPRDSGDWPASLELPGGFIRQSHLALTTTQFIMERIARDIGLDIKEIGTTELVTLFPFSDILECMLVYHVTVTIPKRELVLLRPDLVFIPRDFKTYDQLPGSTLPLHYPSSVIIDRFYKKATA